MFNLSMRYLILLFITSLSFIISLPTLAQSKWKTYKSEWFDIKVPSNFKVQAPKDEESKWPCVFFTSPDRKVDFFVCTAKRIFEVPKDILLDSTTEILVEEKNEDLGIDKMSWQTIKAKDNSYTRLIFMKGENTNYLDVAFGYKYKNKEAYEKYKSTYEKFKKSLIQWTDH